MSAPAEASSRADASSPFSLGTALGAWGIGWFGGNLLAAPFVILVMGASLSDDLTIPQLAVVSVATWASMMGALAVVSRLRGSGSMVADYAATFRPIDLVGVPVGIAAQLLLIPAVYVPLRGLWPDTFDDDEIARRAEELVDRADGWTMVLLALIVIVGAPIVEEFVYRGLLQRSATSATNVWFGLITTSIFFSLVHFSPVEYPGLFVAGLVFGAGVLITGRIGPAIVTHAAFNATGLIVVLQ